MSSQQRSSWRAKQQDMKSRRRNFHGAVTYMFDGIFSWQMYGSADAVGSLRSRLSVCVSDVCLMCMCWVDDNGAPYTEYLMRCQWGTSFENMQPWIVAHRYKEFDILDHQIRREYPLLASSLVSLPKKVLHPLPCPSPAHPIGPNLISHPPDLISSLTSSLRRSCSATWTRR